MQGRAAHLRDPVYSSHISVRLDLQAGLAKLGVLGACPRCDMLSVDQATGTRGKPDVLLELAQYRRGRGGKMHFGVLLAAAAAGASEGARRKCGAGGIEDCDGGRESVERAACARGGPLAGTGSSATGLFGGQVEEEYCGGWGSVIVRVGDVVEAQHR